jgi:glycine/sarcosine N-methyltransferase
MAEDDQYSRVDYRRMIAWPARIERERPLFERVFGDAPEKSLLDVGCGTGEHARFFASLGFRVLGVDASESMLDKARDAENPDAVRFVLGDMRRLGESVPGRWGGALCIGNALPHLTSAEDLDAFARGLHEALLPGAPVLVQILNYDRILAKGERSLPINIRPSDDGEIVFLRLMTPHPDGSVVFYPTTLLLTDDEDEPLRLVASKRVPIRGWRSTELRAAMERAGFGRVELLGNVSGDPFDPESSSDIFLACTRGTRV